MKATVFFAVLGLIAVGVLAQSQIPEIPTTYGATFTYRVPYTPGTTGAVYYCSDDPRLRIDYEVNGELALTYVARFNDGQVYTLSEGQCSAANVTLYDTLLFSVYGYNWVPLADYVGDSKVKGNTCNMFALNNVSNPDGGTGSFVACFSNDTPLALKSYNDPMNLISDAQFATFTPSVPEGTFKVPAGCTGPSVRRARPGQAAFDILQANI